MRRPPAVLARVARRTHVLLPVCLLVALWLPGAHEGWFRTDAHRYAAIALRAFETGEWLALAAGGEPYFNKPPLVFWIHGVTLGVLGPEVWVARAKTLVGAIAAVLLAVRAARLLAGPKTALLAGVVLATTLEFFRYTRTISLDVWQTAAFMLLVAGAAHAHRTGRGGQLLALGGLGVGAALLTKPFVAALPVVILAGWFVIEKRWRLLPWLAGAAALGALIAAPWHWLMIDRFGGAFTGRYFGTETLERATGNELVTSREPVWHGLRVLGETYWPWLAVAALALFDVARRRMPGRDRSALTLALVWTGVWLVALAAFADRRERYMMPIYPLLAWLPALWLARRAPAWLKRPGRAAVHTAAPAALAVGLVGLALTLLTPLRVHEPINPKWDPLVRWLDEHPGAEVFTTPHANTAAANLYLLRGDWPALAGPTPDGFGETAPAGAVLFLDVRQHPDFERLGAVVASGETLRLVRLDRPFAP